MTNHGKDGVSNGRNRLKNNAMYGMVSMTNVAMTKGGGDE